VAAGIPCPIVSGGGTGTFNIDPEARVLTELQAGSYIFMDKQYGEVRIANAAPLSFEMSLFVQTTVISKTTPGLATTDAGLKSFATEAGAPIISSGAPEGANYFFFGDEQGGIILGGAEKALPLGAVLRCVVPHCDPTVNLYDAYHVVDGDRLVDIWPIEARGRSA
jgi:D-serine deaminase-like pyridoxal phosphate-dependent protein